MARRWAILGPVSFLYRVLALVLPLLPKRAAEAVANGTVRLLLGPFRSQRITKMRTLLGSLGSDKRQYKRIDEAHLHFYARIIAESISLPNVSKGVYLSQVTLCGKAHLDKALARGRGALLITDHVGNWMMSATALPMHGYRLSAAAYEIPIPSIQRQMEIIAQRFGIQVYHVGKGVPWAARRVFERNEVLLIVYEMSVRPGQSVWFQLGNGFLPVDIGPALLALKFCVPILLLTNAAGPHGSTHLEILPELDVLPGTNACALTR